jgi:hypothetical protein
MSRSTSWRLVGVCGVGVMIGLALATAGPERPALAHTFSSERALADRVLGALAARDIAALQALPLSEQEFRHIVWPELPASRPDMGMPSEYAWRTLAQNSLANLAQMLDSHGGHRYRLVDVVFDGETTRYASFTVRRKARLIVHDQRGTERHLRLFGAVVERNGRFKLFSYVAD